MIFKLYKDKILHNISESLFFRIIFLLQKYQLIGFDYLKNSLQKKEPVDGINKDDWTAYIKSQEFY